MPVALGDRPLAKQGAYQSELAKARIDIDSARLLVLAAAAALDAHGFKGAKGAIAAAKVSAPNAALRVIDAAVQVHGGAGVSQVRAHGWVAKFVPGPCALWLPDACAAWVLRLHCCTTCACC